VMYADRTSDAMEKAIAETDRRRALQVEYNVEHDITPLSIVKAVYQMESHRDQQSLRAAAFQEASGLPPDEVLRLAKDVEKEMLRAARDLEFERAAELRDRLVELRRRIEGEVEPEPAQTHRGRGRPVHSR
jgi:excinuclease ABC subunit B